MNLWIESRVLSLVSLLASEGALAGERLKRREVKNVNMWDWYLFAISAISERGLRMEKEIF